VVVGKQNWLFYKSYGVTPAQLNLEPFTEDELHDWAQNIVERNSFLKQHHIVNKASRAVPSDANTKLASMGSQEKAFATQIDDAQNYKGTQWRLPFIH
jgi:hypothetical protein